MAVVAGSPVPGLWAGGLGFGPEWRGAGTQTNMLRATQSL